MAEFSAQEFEGDVLAGAMARLGVASRKNFSDDTGSGGSGGSGKDSSDADSGGSEYSYKVAIIGPGGPGGAMLRHLKDLGDVETVLIACDGRGGIIRHSSPVGPIRGTSGTTYANAYFGPGAAFAAMVPRFFFFYALSLCGQKGGRRVANANFDNQGKCTIDLEDAEGNESKIELQFNRDGSLNV
ncbi:hypothetical protein Esi_0227_0017 [Ectocarpus siliculosus]|uniref:Uncharacterized protein n=1 Tax=Ectocarpus siliculosus TaxID=2880 RepID=D7FS34_ECTSI|nr:hypothetical protein Esi_0227_0017 [Ectocarpus siliculosus]|eukprot:CBJ30975.1 hypothetical protein Esi_0227_0017 [Ectocarpus siliculosus]